MTTTRTFKVSGLATLASIVCLALGHTVNALGGLGPLGVLLAMCAWPVFAVSAVRHLLRGLLWRVGTRLFVSYLLIGVVPLPFLAGLAYAGTWMLAGQLAGRRVKAEVVKRDEALAAAALALASEPEKSAARRARVADAARSAGASWAFAEKDGVPEGDGSLPAAALLKNPTPDAQAGRLDD
ncbi:MAG TPA: hypothetical protein VKF32_13495, partial [Thermoanaerobaculia bacterium]|nr:hypothetical protein [Thermoanaerobaculia bacterium]